MEILSYGCLFFAYLCMAFMALRSVVEQSIVLIPSSFVAGLFAVVLTFMFRHRLSLGDDRNGSDETDC
jgi:hypothetical protein